MSSRTTFQKNTPSKEPVTVYNPATSSLEQTTDSSLVLSTVDTKTVDILVLDYLTKIGLTQAAALFSIESGVTLPSGSEALPPDLPALASFATAAHGGLRDMCFNRTPVASGQVAALVAAGCGATAFPTLQYAVPVIDAPAAAPEPAAAAAPAAGDAPASDPNAIKQFLPPEGTFPTPEADPTITMRPTDPVWHAVWRDWRQGQDVRLTQGAAARPAPNGALEEALFAAGFETPFASTTLKTAPLTAVVASLTTPSIKPDEMAREYFALVSTVSAFSNTHTLLETLIARARPPPAGALYLPPALCTLPRASYEMYARKVRHAVAEILFVWVAHVPTDFVRGNGSNALLQQLFAFVEGELIKDDSRIAKRLRAAIARQLSGLSADAGELDSAPLFAPRAPVVGSLASPTAVDPAELARQLTIADSVLFRAVRPADLVYRPNVRSPASVVVQLLSPLQRLETARTDVARVVAAAVAANGVAAVEYWIDVAAQHRDLNNMQGLLSVLDGLAAPVARTAVASLSDRQKRRLDVLTKYRAPEHQEELIRQATESTPPAAVIPDVAHLAEGTLTGKAVSTGLEWQNLCAAGDRIARFVSLQRRAHSLVQIDLVSRWWSAQPREFK